MRSFLFYTVCLTLALIFLPAAIVGDWWLWEEKGTAAVVEETTPPVETIPTGEAIILKVYQAPQNEIVEMELEAYVEGVVSAEMPASFDLEALKAQAVAARSYALCKACAGGGGGCQSHPGADLCTESTCCQAWVNEKEALQKWPPAEAAYYRERIREAIRATRGQVAACAGKPVSAVYHSTCGGKTEAAPEVWGCNDSAHPCLQSVECGYCRHSPYYQTEVAMSFSAYAAALNKEKEALPVLAEGRTPLLEVVKRSASGRNLLLRIGNPGRLYSGNAVRELLGLPSTWFQWRVEGEKIIFSARGHGHGVGMCQYGADGLAKAGKNYKEIIEHYYPGAKVENYCALSVGQDENAPAQGSQPAYYPAVAPADMVDAPDF